MLYSIFWTWLHLLQFCVSNQSLDPEEDSSNKPWRPIPIGLISINGARNLRWVLLPFCLSISVRLEACWQGISLALAILAHNEFGLHSHLFLRNVCNAWGYASFNAGALTIVSGTFSDTTCTAAPRLCLQPSPFWLETGQTTISTRSQISFAINALIIITTIYAQDFRDEIGDKCMGRRTVAIVWPEGSRISICMILIAWSVGLSWACELSSFFAVPFCVLAAFVGLRFLRKRTKEADQRSYRYYNVRTRC